MNFKSPKPDHIKNSDMHTFQSLHIFCCCSNINKTRHICTVAFNHSLPQRFPAGEMVQPLPVGHMGSWIRVVPEVSEIMSNGVTGRFQALNLCFVTHVDVLGSGQHKKANAPKIANYKFGVGCGLKYHRCHHVSLGQELGSLFMLRVWVWCV